MLGRSRGWDSPIREILGFEFLDVDLEMFDLGLEFSNPLKRRLEFLRGRFPALRSTPLALFFWCARRLGWRAEYLSCLAPKKSRR